LAHHVKKRLRKKRLQKPMQQKNKNPQKMLHQAIEKEDLDTSNLLHLEKQWLPKQ